VALKTGSGSLRRPSVLVALALTLVALALTATSAAAWDPATLSPGDETALFALTNADRSAAGLPALLEDAYLHKEAEWRVEDMGTHDYFAHEIPPDGKTVFDYMNADGYCYAAAGENIGESTYADDGATAKIEAAFMNSPEHRDNILGTWTNLGVGAYESATGKKYYAVLFSLACKSAQPAPTTAPAPVPTAVPTAMPTTPPVPTARPTAKLTARPTPKPTPRPTPVPTARPSASATPTSFPVATIPGTSPAEGGSTVEKDTSTPPSGIIAWLSSLSALLHLQLGLLLG